MKTKKPRKDPGGITLQQFSDCTTPKCRYKTQRRTCMCFTEKCSPGACTQKDSLTSRLHFLVLHASASVMSHFFYWLRPPLPARSIDYKDMNDWCCLQLEGSCPECSNTEIPILTKRGVNTLFKLIWDLAASGHLYYHLYCVLLSFSILL